MAKAVRCRDVGFDYEGIIRAKTKEAALAQAIGGLTEIWLVSCS